MKRNMLWRRGLLALAVLAALLFVVGCRQESEIIGLQRPVYSSSEATIKLHYFPIQSKAEAYYANRGIDEYFLFTIPEGDASIFLEELEADEYIEDEGKLLHFEADGDSSARDKVVDFIDENNLWNIRN